MFNIDRSESISKQGLLGTTKKTAHRTDDDGRIETDTFGRVYFTILNNPRHWNGIICDMMTPERVYDYKFQYLRGVVCEVKNSASVWGSELMNKIKSHWVDTEYCVWGVKFISK